MAPPATSAANKGFIGDGAVVSYLNNKGDNHETCGNGTRLGVCALQHLRICPHRSSQAERQDSSQV
jgi:diaminopimelate epimerase